MKKIWLVKTTPDAVTYSTLPVGCYWDIVEHEFIVSNGVVYQRAETRPDGTTYRSINSFDVSAE